MARNGGELVKSLMMFRSDAVQAQGKVLSEFGKRSAIKKRLADKTISEEERTKLKAELKKLSKSSGKAVLALMLSSVWIVGASHLMNLLYNKERDKDEILWASALWELVGNLIGGLPGIANIADYFVNGFDIESMEMGTINDILSAVTTAFEFGGKLLSGTAEQRDTNSVIKKTVFTFGQASGIPFRNLFNTVYGLIRRFNESAAYKFDDLFKKRNYSEDFKNAAQEGKNILAEDILQMTFEANIGEGVDDKTLSELVRLASLGHKVAPSAISKSITIDGESYELTAEESETVQEIYAEAVAELNKLVVTNKYNKLDDKEKEKEIKALLARYRKMGYDEIKETSYGIKKKNTSPYANLFSPKKKSDSVSGPYSALFSGKASSSGSEGTKKLSYAALLGVK